MNKILLFGGTTEGRLAAEIIFKENVPMEICVATDYGPETLSEDLKSCTHTGRMDTAQMINFINNGHFTHVVDATHPYAAEATQNIQAACAGTGAVYLRLLRDEDAVPLPENALEAETAQAAASMLAASEGPVFLTTGAKEVPDFLTVPNAAARLFIRVLPNADALNMLKTEGFSGSHIICMQGPFDTDMNLATLRHIRKVWRQEQPDCPDAPLTLVTKQSGRVGGFKEKCEAANTAGADLLIIGRPQEADGVSLQEFSRFVCGLSGGLHDAPPDDRQVWLIGLGMSPAHLTREADDALRGCDLIVGAKRMLEMTAAFGKETFCSYNYPEIIRHLEEHPEYRKIAVVFSGDIGFYSGAARMRECLAGLPYEVHAVSGIASPVHFLGAIGKTWEDVHLASLHGRASSMTALVRVHEKTLFLLGKDTDVSDICRQLIASGYENAVVWVGADLMQDNEVITCGRPADFCERKYSPLSMIYIENPDAAQAPVACALPDEVFIRGSVPMTKAPVRAQILSALQLTPHAVLYDVGAGTGSVSIAAARCIPEGKVYAIEKNPEGLSLIDQNRVKLQADNVCVVDACAPDAPELPRKPTHAFIGGSSGNLKEIIYWLKGLNPDCRIVLTAVTLETVTRVLSCCSELSLGEPEMIQIQATRTKKAGSSHLMQAENPVWVITIG